MDDYNLIYFCKETGREVKARKIFSDQYSIFDPVTNEKEQMNSAALRKKYKSSKLNNSAATKKAHSRPRLYSARTYTKEFREYLKETCA